MSSYDGLCPDCREIECTDDCIMESNRRIVSNFRKMANRTDYRAAKWEQESKRLAHLDGELSDYYAKIAEDMRRDAGVYRRMAKKLAQP